MTTTTTANNGSAPSERRIPQILTIDEACDVVGLSRHRIRGMIRREELITLDFGDGVLFIARDEIQRWLEEHRPLAE